MWTYIQRSMKTEINYLGYFFKADTLQDGCPTSKLLIKYITT